MGLLSRKSPRWEGFDYTTETLYFLTSCVQNRACWFGEINGGKMALNCYGTIVMEQWCWLEKHFSYVRSHSFTVMPNHVHGILEINCDEVDVGQNAKIKSVSDLVGAFKTTSSKRIHSAYHNDQGPKHKKPFQWQRSFHDHVIRNQEAYFQIVEYIENNPLRWNEDELHM